ncbi:uncharacterized protein LOC130635483 [Hydractinia symbiolongicarpus]|uniref:uncharacterized protein LOC130635483 n=1 Tax=Hydractinia symbiolongicarpus TaxID=13093 RepID=UPI002551A566|nr:uncharacterized protein LOC130635483 [Hydractinia symbiolongicarpus]
MESKLWYLCWTALLNSGVTAKTFKCRSLATIDVTPERRYIADVKIYEPTEHTLIASLYPNMKIFTNTSYTEKSRLFCYTFSTKANCSPTNANMTTIIDFSTNITLPINQYLYITTTFTHGAIKKINQTLPCVPVIITSSGIKLNGAMVMLMANVFFFINML